MAEDDNGLEIPDHPVGKATISDRIAAFTMPDGMKDATQAQKAMRLSLVGFSASEIAAMLQTTAPTVHQSLYSERKKLKPASKSPRQAQGRRSLSPSARAS